MVVLLTKLENMLQNSLYVNILLTGIVAQLACYPQPLLRSFLLNTNMVFQPSVKSLIQVHSCKTSHTVTVSTPFFIFEAPVLDFQSFFISLKPYTNKTNVY